MRAALTDLKLAELQNRENLNVVEASGKDGESSFAQRRLLLSGAQRVVFSPSGDAEEEEEPGREVESPASQGLQASAPASAAMVPAAQSDGAVAPAEEALPAGTTSQLAAEVWPGWSPNVPASQRVTEAAPTGP